MTNFNHTQIACNIYNQIDDVMVNSSFSKNDGNAFRIAITHWFMKFNREGIKDDFDQTETVELYDEAIEHTTAFGKMMMGAPDGEAGMAKAMKLRKAVFLLVKQELEGGTGGDGDYVFRILVQQLLLAMYKQLKRDAGEEVAGLVVEMNNAVNAAINAELEVANAA